MDDAQLSDVERVATLRQRHDVVDARPEGRPWWSVEIERLAADSASLRALDQLFTQEAEAVGVARVVRRLARVT